MATAINVCPLCGGTLSIEASVNARLTLHDNEPIPYELTTAEDDIVRQIKSGLGSTCKCHCNDCGDHRFYVKQHGGDFEISDVPFDDRKEDLIEWIEENYPDGYEICAGYDDEICDEKVRKILESINPEEAFQDYIDYLYAEQSRDAVTVVAQQALDDGFEDLDERDVREIVSDKLEIILPEDHYLEQPVKVDVYVDTGDADYDFVSNAMYPHYNGRKELWEEVDEEQRSASLFWLAETQGYDARTFFEAMQDDVEHTDSKFLKSVFDELDTMPTHMPCLVFLRTFTLRTLISMIKDKEDVYIPENTTCGLYDKWSGGGGLMGIELEKSLHIPFKNVHETLPATSYKYNIKTCYEMMGWEWETNKNPYGKRKV